MPNTLSFNSELKRKIIHLSSSIIALLIWIYGKEIILPFLITASIIFPLLDYLRRHITIIKFIYLKLFNTVTRPHEHYILSGASWVFIGSALSLFIYSEQIAIISILVLSISDSLAAIIGLRYGHTKIFNKSLEGSLGFCLSASIIILTLSDNLFIINFFAIITATFIELYQLKNINDNLSIPLVTGAVLSIGYIL